MCAIASTRNNFFVLSLLAAMRASIPKPRVRSPRRQSERAHLNAPFLHSVSQQPAYGFGASAKPAACVTSRICVPLSRCRFFPAEVINDPCAAPVVAELRFTPCIPKTPRLFDINCPVAFSPPTAPGPTAAVSAAECTVESTPPPAVLPAFAAVFVPVPAAPPAVEVTPPNAPPPEARPEPPAYVPVPPAADRSLPVFAFAADCPEASA